MYIYRIVEVTMFFNTMLYLIAEMLESRASNQKNEKKKKKKTGI